MSRIGRKTINIPAGVSITKEGEEIVVSGVKGELRLKQPLGVTWEVMDNQLEVKRTTATKQARANHGLLRSLLASMIVGVSEGFVKKLELVGTGYRVKKQGKDLVLSVGYSHQVEYKSREGVDFEIEGDTNISISGVDKQAIGQVAAEIRSIRPPEPYKGKGIRYKDEVIRRKAGKASKTAA